MADAAPAVAAAAPAATPADATIPANANPGGAPPTTFDWSQHGLDQETMGWVQTKGYKGPGDVIHAYRNAEKLLGAPSEQILRLPGAKDAPESWNQVWDRLGRPANADGYKLPVPDGADPAFAKTAAGWFHEAGLSASQAEKVVAKWNEHMAGQVQQTQQAYREKVAVDEAALKLEWGGNFDANVALAKRAAAAFNLDAPTIDKLEEVMGFGGSMKFMHNLGSKLGTDDSFIAGDTRSAGFAAMSPQQAQAEIAELRADKGFVQKYTSGDKDARARMARLHQIAYPGEVSL